MLKEVVVKCGFSCFRPEVFTINGAQADMNDFGHMEDVAPEYAPEYGCGDRRFISYDPKDNVLELYGITESEYETICNKLESEMHIGGCGWCA